MASMQLKLMNDLYASIKARVSKPGLDLATNRDNPLENLHLAASEPRRSRTLKWDAATYRHCGVSRKRAATRPASSCTATPVARFRTFDAHRPERRWAHRESRGCPRPRV